MLASRFIPIERLRLSSSQLAVPEMLPSLIRSVHFDRYALSGSLPLAPRAVALQAPAYGAQVQIFPFFSAKIKGQALLVLLFLAE